MNLPVSDGLIFRLSRQAPRLGLDGPLRRMWRAGLPSPNLSYFSEAMLPRLFAEAGFSLVRSAPLRSISPDGLYERIRADRGTGTLAAVVLYSAARLVALGARAFPSYIRYFVFRRNA